MSKAPVVCSIVTKSHLAYARVLAKSLRDHHENVRYIVLLADKCDGFFDSESEPFQLIQLRDLQLPEESRLCFQYTAFELCNALKPRLLKYVRNLFPGEPVVYLDSDMLLFDRLSTLLELASESEIVLSPHATTLPLRAPKVAACLPEDLLITQFLQAGFFNAGLVTVGTGAEADKFVSWWNDMTDMHCLNRMKEGYFVDQKFLDAVPALFSGTHVIRDPGFNVGWFNLHERIIEKREEGWWVNGKPLVLFHFTQCDPRTMQFESWATGSSLKEQPILAELAVEYSLRLREAGYEECRTWPYSWATFEDGTPIRDEVRKVFWKDVLATGSSENPFESSKWRAAQSEWIEAKKAAQFRERSRIHRLKRCIKELIRTDFPKDAWEAA